MFPGSSILGHENCWLHSCLQKLHPTGTEPGTRRVMNAVAVHGKVPPGPVVVKLVVQDFAPDRRGMEWSTKISEDETTTEYNFWNV